MKNMFKILTLSLTALTSSRISSTTITFDDSAIVSQIVCSDQEEVIQDIANDIIAQQKNYTQNTLLTRQNLLTKDREYRGCVWLRLFKKSEKQRQ